MQIKNRVTEIFRRGIVALFPESVIKFLQSKFIYEPRIRHLKFTKKNIPIFDTVFFEVRTKCNGICQFCSASGKNDTRKDESMPFETYKKVVDQLEQLNFSGRIAYHVNNDPLIFPSLVDFIEYARPKLPGAWFQILTNGRALTAEKAENIIKARINELSINWYNDNFEQELPEAIRLTRDKIIPKYYKKEQIKSGGRPANDKNIFVFNVERRKSTGFLTSRAGTSPNKKEKSKMPRGFCEYPFTQFNITADGRVSECCADFHFQYVMGNVNEENLMDIWNGHKFNSLRSYLMKGNRAPFETCSKCDFYGSRRAYSFFAKVLYWFTR